MTATVTDINNLATTPQPKVETVRIAVVGFRGEHQIVQNLEFNRPVGVDDPSTLGMAWRQIQMAGGIMTNTSERKATIHPFGSFDQIELEVSPVVGVTL